MATQATRHQSPQKPLDGIPDGISGKINPPTAYNQRLMGCLNILARYVERMLAREEV
jgi:hypothetical protein